jgi:hypothetical protein
VVVVLVDNQQTLPQLEEICQVIHLELLLYHLAVAVVVVAELYLRL